MTYDVRAQAAEWAASEVAKWGDGEEIGWSVFLGWHGGTPACAVYLQAQGQFAIQGAELPADEDRIRAATRRAMETLGHLITEM
jgi:hypothetical protein